MAEHMRLPLPTALLAAALLAPAAALASGCGGSDRPAAATPASSKQRQPAATPAPPTVQQRLDAVVTAGSPGAISLVNDGHTVTTRAAGVADLRSKRPLRPDDRFRAGSITKSFVSVVALQLVGEGRLSLSDTVEHWLPGILPYGDKVNLRQLLNLTSGVPDNQLPVNIAIYRGDKLHAWTPRELVALVADKPQEFPAGKGWAYSNTNYALAGMIIERAAHHSLAHELQRRIFEPLRLRDTSFPVNEPVLPGSHSNGYSLDYDDSYEPIEGKLLDLTSFNPSGTWAAGNLVSTAADIAHFWRAVLGGKLLPPAQLAEMKTTVPAWEGTNIRYGLGLLESSPSRCGRVLGNGGDIAGFSNVFQNNEDGTRQAATIVNANAAPELAGEARNGAQGQALSMALADHSCAGGS
jgi:D-alanyl-D-alanine carboxypeptidase